MSTTYNFVNAYNESIVDIEELKPLIQARVENMVTFMRMFPGVGILRTRVTYNDVSYIVTLKMEH